MTTYWIAYGLLLAVSIVAEAQLIEREGTYHGWRKTVYLVLLYCIITIAAAIYIHHEGWIMIPKLLPVSTALWWLIKDTALGYILHGDILYLGTGRWDRMWLQWPPALLFFFKNVLATISVVLYLHPNWIAFSFYSGVLTILIIILYIKTK